MQIAGKLLQEAEATSMPRSRNGVYHGVFLHVSVESDAKAQLLTLASPAGRPSALMYCSRITVHPGPPHTTQRHAAALSSGGKTASGERRRASWNGFATGSGNSGVFRRTPYAPPAPDIIHLSLRQLPSYHSSLFRKDGMANARVIRAPVSIHSLHMNRQRRDLQSR